MSLQTLVKSFRYLGPMSMTIAIKYARLPHGLIYFYQHWIPKRPRALVIFVHGLGDHIGRYSVFVSRMAQAGFGCAMFDQRGHGRSEGRRGHIERFADWVNDIAGFVQFSEIGVPEGTPLFIVGYSLGALIGINYVLMHALPVDGMVTLSAAIVPTVGIPTWKKKIGKKIARFFSELSIDNGINIADLTHDEKERAALEADSFFHRRITLGAAGEIERNLELVMAMPHRLHLPMLMLAGAKDRICDPEGTRRFAMRLSSTDKRYRIYPGMSHDLLHDVGWENILEDIISWISERADKRPKASRQIALHRREILWEDVSLPS